MSGLFSKACEYAIQSVIYMAGCSREEYVSQKDMAKKLGVPSHFLGKILQSLTRQSIVISVRGKGGGFQLGKKSNELTLLEIVEAVEGKPFLDGCLLGLPGCRDDFPCQAHASWKKIKTDLIKLLSKSVKQFNKGYDVRISRSLKGQ